MLVKRIGFNDFIEEFKKYGREETFSYQGKKALYDYLNQLAEDLGKPIELDIIGLCCLFTEYENLEKFNKDYGYSLGYDIEDIEEIQEHTILIPVNEESFIIEDF